MIREIREDDVPKLRALGYAWTMGKDFMGGVVAVDASDEPRMALGAWRMAEIHGVTDSTWNTPQERWETLQRMHRAMERRLSTQGVGEVVVWFERRCALVRRMLSLGWVIPQRRFTLNREVRG